LIWGCDISSAQLAIVGARLAATNEGTPPGVGVAVDNEAFRAWHVRSPTGCIRCVWTGRTGSNGKATRSLRRLVLATLRVRSKAARAWIGKITVEVLDPREVPLGSCEIVTSEQDGARLRRERYYDCARQQLSALGQCNEGRRGQGKAYEKTRSSEGVDESWPGAFVAALLHA